MLGRLRHALGGGKEEEHPGADGRRVEAAPLPGAATGAGLPPLHPPSPFDSPTAPAASPTPTHASARPCGGAPALSRTSLNSCLCRDEVCADAAPQLSQRVSQQLARMSADPRLQRDVKATLRREAAEVHSLPSVPSAELLPQLESVLSFGRGGAGAASAPAALSAQEEARGLAEVGVPAKASAGSGGGVGEEHRYV